MNPRLAVVALATAALAACGGAAPPAAPAGAVPALETLVVEPASTRRERVWDGVVEAANQATLSAQTAGRVVELPYDVDAYVPAGAVVVRFTDVEQQSGRRRAEAALAGAEAAAKEAEADFARTRDVYAKKLVAKAQLDQATARRDATHAALDAARAAVREAAEQVDYTRIRAPYSGIVTQRHVEVGESVRPGQPLISGLSLGELRVAVEIPQSDVAGVREHLAAAVLPRADTRIDAKAVTVFPYADPKTHTFRVRVELPAAETGLYPGMTVKTAFVVGEAERLLVPETALVRRGETRAVYVVDGAAVRLRQLRLGHRFGAGVEVLAGLVAGERIALDPVAAGLHLAAQREGG